MKATASCLLTVVLRTITGTIVAALLLAWLSLPTVAQTAVPSSATQAAKMPQYASRLAHAAARPSSRQTSSAARQGSRTEPPDGPIYENGSINGTVDAWPIGFGSVVSNSVTLGGATELTGMTFGVWLFPGDILESAEISVTSSEFGGTTYFDQTVPFSQSNCTTNQFGFTVCTATSSTFNSAELQPGTYWVNLVNSTTSSGDPVYWDENSGVGCASQGCPSQASENSVGTIPSESFTIVGNNPPPPTCYQSAGNLQTIASFTPQQAGPYPGPNGVVMDNSGNLYGTTVGGSNNEGFAYKLAHFASWLLEPLFNFAGDNNGGPPTDAIVGPNGSLYGGAQGGIQNCGSDGSQYCGLVYNLKPKPNPCATALCGWNESVPYRFTSEADGSGVINVSAKDQQGNIYGTTTTGGAHGVGTVFELSPSGGGWTKTTLYSFTYGVDGDTPTQVLVGNDGNLYGLANAGRNGGGLVFELSQVGGQWSERTIHIFLPPAGGTAAPSYLVQDGSGNLLGALNQCCTPFPSVFKLQKAGSGWSYSALDLLHSCSPQDIPFGSINNLTIDANGTLYGTGAGGEEFARSSGSKPPGGGECSYNYIFKASNDSGGWHYDDLWFRENVYFSTQGSLAVDSSGNLYGTTAGCGTYNSGTVWQLSP